MADPNEPALWKEALAQGPYDFDEEGSLLAAEGPQLANPALHGEKLRAYNKVRN